MVLLIKDTHLAGELISNYLVIKSEEKEIKSLIISHIKITIQTPIKPKHEKRQRQKKPECSQS